MKSVKNPKITISGTVATKSEKENTIILNQKLKAIHNDLFVFIRLPQMLYLKNSCCKKLSVLAYNVCKDINSVDSKIRFDKNNCW